MYIYLFSCQWQSFDGFVFNIPIIIDMKLIKHYQAKFWKLESVTSILHLNLEIYLAMI